VAHLARFGSLADPLDQIELLHDLRRDPPGSHVICEQMVVRFPHQVRQLQAGEEHGKQTVEKCFAGRDVQPPDVSFIAQSDRRHKFPDVLAKPGSVTLLPICMGLISGASRVG
jgi:hypothetical protein